MRRELFLGTAGGGLSSCSGHLCDSTVLLLEANGRGRSLSGDSSGGSLLLELSVAGRAIEGDDRSVEEVNCCSNRSSSALMRSISLRPLERW